MGSASRNRRFRDGTDLTRTGRKLSVSSLFRSRFREGRLAASRLHIGRRGRASATTCAGATCSVTEQGEKIMEEQLSALAITAGKLIAPVVIALIGVLSRRLLAWVDTQKKNDAMKGILER